MSSTFEVLGDVKVTVEGECCCCGAKFKAELYGSDFTVEYGDEWGNEKTKVCMDFQCDKCQNFLEKKIPV